MKLITESDQSAYWQLTLGLHSSCWFTKGDGASITDEKATLRAIKDVLRIKELAALAKLKPKK